MADTSRRAGDYLRVLLERGEEPSKALRKVAAVFEFDAAAPGAGTPAEPPDTYVSDGWRWAPGMPGPVAEVRARLVARLRAVIEWVSERDHGKAVELDRVVHELEALAVAAPGADTAADVPEGSAHARAVLNGDGPLWFADEAAYRQAAATILAENTGLWREITRLRKVNAELRSTPDRPVPPPYTTQRVATPDVITDGTL